MGQNGGATYVVDVDGELVRIVLVVGRFNGNRLTKARWYRKPSKVAFTKLRLYLG
jgi:hypothetical protein